MILKKFIAFPKISVLLCLFATPTTAQIVPDNTLPQNSIVTPQGNIIQIDGGTERGNNLFHSFEQFSVPIDNTAFFNNAVNIENIFSRVTGASISEINGIIRANGFANLFLINPNGIIFGDNASLNIGGSFFATSADRVVFADSSEFRATNPNDPPLLTINIPIGLGFRENPGSIVNRSFASIVEVDETGEEFEQFVGLQVPPGQTLALVGGEVSLESGILTAEGGRIEIGSVAGNSLVSLTPSEQGFALSYPGVVSFQDISLSQGSRVDLSGQRGGDFQIQGRQVTLTEASQIFSGTILESGGDGVITASQSLEMSGNGTAILTNTQGSGTAGDLTLETGKLTLREGAIVATVTNAGGNTGNLTVRASEAVELIGTNSDGSIPSALAAQVIPLTSEGASGQGGTILIETGQLLVQDGAQVSAVTLSSGQAGNLIVKSSESIELIGRGLLGPSGLSAATLETATGNSGTITLETGRLIVRDGAQVATTTFSTGDAGSLTVKASESVELIGRTVDNEFASALSVQVEPRATGNGGTLTIETGQLTVLGGAQIASATAGSEGQGATVTINADSIFVSGTAPVEDVGVRESSGIFVTAEPVIRDEETEEPVRDEFGNQIITGADAGQLFINAEQLIVEDAAKVSAENFGTGLGGNATLNVDRLIVRSGGLVSAGSLIEEGVESVERGPGGTLKINAAESIEVTGTGNLGSTPVVSRLVAESQGTGDAGDLDIVTPNLRVTDEAEVTVSATGTGEAGSLTVSGEDIRLENGSLRAETRLGTQGNIILNGEDIRLRQGSAITTNSLETGTGGNIEINTDLLTAIENSDISANALAGPGGRVTVNALGIFGTQFRLQQTSASDITATSELGPEFSGTVELNTEIDPSSGLIEFSQTVVDPNDLIAQEFCKQRGSSEFVIRGRGGIAAGPNDKADGNQIEVDLVEPVKPQPQNPSRQRSEAEQNQPISSLDIIPARGWIRDENGDVILVSYDPTKTGVRRQSPQLPQCQESGVRSQESGVRSKNFVQRL